jgi:hypothetical protein
MPVSKDLINPKPIDPLFGEKIIESSKAIANIQGMDFNYKAPQYSQGEIALSAFERENTIVSSIMEGSFQANIDDASDPEFDVVDYVDTDIKNSDYAPYWQDFVEVKNYRQANALKAKIDRQNENERIISEGGGAGIAWSLAAGILDPINLFPILGGVSKAYKAGKYAKGIGLTAGAGALGMTASEGILQATQETRTLEESAINIGAGTLLAGALGGVGAMISKKQFNNLADKFKKDLETENADVFINPDTQKMEIRPDSASAANVAEFQAIRKYYDDVLTPQLKAEGKEIPAFADFKKQQQSLASTITQDIAGAVNVGNVIQGQKLLKKINLIDNLNPIQRLTQTQFAVSPRETAEKLMKTGLMWQKNKIGIASAQSAEIAKKTLQAPYFNNYKPIENKAYYNFKKRIKKEGALNETENNIKNDIQFFEELSRANRNGDKSTIPEINELAKSSRNDVLNHLGREAVNVGLLSEKVLTTKPKTSESYFPRLFNRLKVIARENELRQFLNTAIKERLLPNIKKAEAQKELNLNSQILDLQTRKAELQANLDKAANEKFQKAQVDAVFNKENISNTQITLNNLNPTGTIFDNYTPEVRANANLANNITTLDKTMEVSPDKIITIYRGAPKNQKEIVAGDFITTNKQLAKDYAGDGVVLSEKVKASEILDDINEPLGEEYIYKPKNTNINTSDIVINEADISTENKFIFQRNISWAKGGEKSFDEFLEKMAEDLPDSLDFPADKIEKVYNKYVKNDNLIYTNEELAEILDKYKNAIKTVKSIKPKSLLIFLRDRGGVVDFGGNLKAMGITNKTLPGLIRKGKESGNLFGAGKKEYIDLDDARFVAQEQGYFSDFPQDGSGGQPSINDLLDLMRREVGGEKIYSLEDVDKIEIKNNAERLIEELNEMGIDIDKINEAVLLEKGKIKKKFKYLSGENVDKKTISKMDKVLAKSEIDLLEKKVNKLKNKYNENQVNFRSKFEEMGDEDSYVNEITSDIINQLKGDDRLGLIDDLGIKVAKRGPLKERTLNFVQDNELEPWLENDARKVLNYYQNTLSTDIEISRAFDGDLTLDDAITTIQEEYAEVIAKTTDPKILKQIDKEKKTAINDLTSVAKIMRGMYARPDNPDSMIVRGGRIARQYNYVTKMGQVAIASITDISNPIRKHGLKTWAKTLPNLITNLEGIKLNVKEAKLAGNITDIVLPERMASFSGLNDPFASNLSSFEKYLENISKALSKTNLMPVWNDAQKGWSSVLSQQRMIDAIKKFDKINEKETAYLGYLGIGRDNYKIIADELSQHAYKEGRLLIANTEKWNNPEAVRIYRNALNTDIDSTIVTVGAGDLPLWMQTEAGKVVGQFKSFVFGATQQVLVSSLQQKDMAALNGLISAVGLGMMAYYFKAKLAGREVSKDPSVWIAEGIDRSGYFAVLADFSHIADKVGLGASSLLGTGQLSRYQSRNIGASLLGPSVGLLGDAAISIGALKSGEISEADAKAIRRMIWFNNHFLLTKAMDNFEKAIANQ